MVKQVSKPVQKIVRVGTPIDYHYEVAEFGSDENGRFAVVNVGDASSARVYCTFVGDNEIGVSMFQPLTSLTTTTADPFVPDEKVNPKDVVAVEEKKPAKKSVAPKVNVPVEVTEKLNVILTDEERSAAAKTVSVLLGELDDAKQELKAYNTLKKNEIKLIEEKISREKQAHNTGLEYRTVKCLQHFDPIKSITWFTHEGKEYGSRKMNEREERELRSPSLFKDAPMLPNRVEETSPDADPKKIEKKMKNEIENFNREKKNKKPVIQNETPYSTKDDEIREVMNEEKKKGGKHDHSV